MKKGLFLFTLILIASLLVACSPKAVEQPAPAVPESPEEDSAPVEVEEDVIKVALVGNQRFGDLGPMDAFARGLDRCATDFGFEVKKLESTDAGRFEEDIRAMAREDYDMIVTTFPAMTDASVTVAQEFPDSVFYTIYQFANAGEMKTPNVWSTEFRGYESNYVLGAMQGKLSSTKKLGYIYGSEEPSINSDVNGYVQGVKETCPECIVEVASANSWEDPAVGKEIALAMINRGVDVIQTEAAKTQLGAIEAAKEEGVYFFGDNGDNYDFYKEGFVTYVNASFENALYNGCKAMYEGNVPGGEHTFQNLANLGVFVPWEPVDRFINDNPEKAEEVKAAYDFAKEIEDKIINGEIVVTYNEDSPVGIK